MDLSWGALDAITTALDITMVELEGPQGVTLDLPQAER